MDVGRHPNIRLLAYSEVEKVEGDVGDFRITVRKKARYVDESKCTGCGTCAEKCPTVISDEYNLGLAKAKAIYKYFAQGIPSTYTIDAAHCRNFQPGKKCGVCAKVCQAGAVDYKQEDQVLEIPVGAIIVATGYDLFDARSIPEYGYGRTSQRDYGPGIRTVPLGQRSHPRPCLPPIGPGARRSSARDRKSSSRRLPRPWNNSRRSSNRASDEFSAAV